METGYSTRGVVPNHGHGATWALMAALYVATSILDRSLVFFAAELSAIPLAGGIAFVTVYRLGMVGAAMVFVLSFTVSLWTGTVPADGIVWSSFDTANAVLGVALLRSVIGMQAPFGSTKRVFSFLLLGAAVPTLLTSGAGQILANLTAFSAPDGLLIWWLGGAVGCIVCAPLLVTLSTRPVIGRDMLETVALLAASLFLALSFTGEIDLSGDEFPLQYLIFPLLLWAVFRSGLGVAAIILVFSIVATLWGTTEGFGPFVRDSVAETSLLLQAFFGVTTVTVLLLHAAREGLEINVVERTAELNDAMREAEEANKTKSRFLAAASHDLRQPIQAISLFSAALKTRLKEHENAKLVSKVQASLSSLGNMLDGLLDMSRLENDAIVPQLHDFHVQGMLDEIIAEHMPVAEAKNIELRVISSSAVLCSDRTLLSRIIGNFITNAIRYTDQGRVLVGCRRCGDRVRVEIWDTGKGMSAGDVDHVFDPYRRLDDSENSAAEGLGLGLSICEGLAKILKHPIGVRSDVGAGSVFFVEIPGGSAPNTASAKKISSALFSNEFKGCTVLAVDDNIDVLEGMASALTSWGCEVVQAMNITDALDAAENLGDKLGLVISDYHLFNRDTGLELLVLLEEVLKRKVPAIIISGDTLPERRSEINAAGYFLLTKPIQPVVLRSLMRHHLGGPT